MIIADAAIPLAEVLLLRKTFRIEENPRLRLVDEVVLKNGPQAYKIARQWVILNEHTGEFHHHSLEIETLKRQKSGWSASERAKVALEGDEIEFLLAFLRATREAPVPEETGGYWVIPSATPKGAIDGAPAAKLRELLSKHSEYAVEALALLARSESPAALAKRLEQFSAEDIPGLNTALAIINLQRVLDIWEANQEIDAEEFWQDQFTSNGFILAQLFTLPVVILKDKAYVGGKTIFNTGANLLDYLMRVRSTENTALVEIKTPRTNLLGSEYRPGIYNASQQLSGGTQQLRDYRDSLTKEYNSLVRNTAAPFCAFTPVAILIIGDTRELDTPEKVKSFELFRAGQADVTVISFDELFDKIRALLQFLTTEEEA